MPNTGARCNTFRKSKAVYSYLVIFVLVFANLFCTITIHISSTSGDGGNDVVAAESWESNRIPTNAARDKYERLRQNPNATFLNSKTGEIMPQPQVVHRAVSGLGHRLMRMSGMYHTLRIQQFQHLHSSWGWECGKNEEGNPDIYDNLFGYGPVAVTDILKPDIYSQQPPSEYEGMFRFKTDPHEVQRIINDVPSYQYHTRCPFKKPSLLYEKAISDEQLFRQLRTLFRFNDRVRAFTKEHSFSERLVFGIHVRHGNGETGDFMSKERGFHDIDSWIEQTAQSLRRLANKITMASNRSLSKLPPLLFVATDRIDVVEKLANATKPYGFSTVSFPQNRPNEGTGVSYIQVGKGPTCQESWVAQFIDAILLGVSDVMVAGRYSSFSQAIPLYAVLADSIKNWDRPPGFDPGNRTTYNWPNTSRNEHKSVVDETFYSHRLFCESNVSGDKLNCYDDYFEWLWSDTGSIIRQKIGNETIWVPYSKEVYDPCPTS